jgi:hypothetical protein
VDCFRIADGSGTSPMLNLTLTLAIYRKYGVTFSSLRAPCIQNIKPGNSVVICLSNDVH